MISCGFESAGIHARMIRDVEKPYKNGENVGDAVHRTVARNLIPRCSGSGRFNKSI